MTLYSSLDQTKNIAYFPIKVYFTNSIAVALYLLAIDSWQFSHTLPCNALAYPVRNTAIDQLIHCVLSIYALVSSLVKFLNSRTLEVKYV